MVSRVSFFKPFRILLEEEVNGLVEDFSIGIEVLRKLNATHIVLIPKVSNLSSVNHFRLISLCNYS